MTRRENTNNPQVLVDRTGSNATFCNSLVIHRELQNVVYMKKNRCSRKRGEGPVHKYLWVICIFSSCHKILLYNAENILTDIRRK